MTSRQRNILVSVPFFDADTRAYLEQNDCHLTVLDGPDGNRSESELIALLEGKQGWIVGHARVTSGVLQARPDLAVVARRGVGYERVDVQTAGELGRVVTIAAGGNAPSVADHTVGLMLAAGRLFHESQQRMAGGQWGILVGTELFGRTVGLVGFGRIAKLVAKRLQGFDVRVLAYAPRGSNEDAAAHGVSFVDMATLLRESDYLSLHVPLTPETKSLIDDKALLSMKSTAILVNTSRGGLVDEQALAQALRTSRLGAAALDVFAFETECGERATAEELLALPNFTATPHAAGSTHEALVRSNRLAAQAVVAVLDGKAPPAEMVIVDGRRT